MKDERVHLAILVAILFVRAFPIPLTVKFVNGEDVYGTHGIVLPEYCKTSLVSENEIQLELLKDYSNVMRPTRNATTPIDVKLSIVIERVVDIIEKEKSIYLEAYLQLIWKDDFLVWVDKPPYDCLTKMIFPSNKIWHPDVVVTNAGDKYSLLYSHGHKIEATNDGHMIYYPSGVFATNCELDLTYFPFDNQICTVRLASWSYWTDLQKFSLFDPPLYYDGFQEHEQWHLFGASSNMYAVPDSNGGGNSTKFFERIEFSLYLKRKAAYYLVNVIIPSCIISIVEIVTFSLSLMETLKVHISFTALLAFGVFQMIMTQDIPKASQHSPLLGVCIDLQMVYIGFVLIAEGITFLIVNKAAPKKPPPPQWLYEIAFAVGRLTGAVSDDDLLAMKIQNPNYGIPIPTVLEKFLILGGFRNKESDANKATVMITKGKNETRKVSDNFINFEKIGKDRYRRGWIVIAKAVDRLALVIYILALSFTPPIIFSFLPDRVHLPEPQYIP